MKKIDVIFISIIAIIVGIFFYQTLLFGKLPIPSDALVGLYHPWRDLYASEFPRGVPFKNSLITDPIRQQIPWRKVVIDYWRSGTIPTWNPYNFSGTSLSANIQAAPFYPLNILFIIFDFPNAWTLLIILQPLLSGFWMYLYLRNLGLNEYSSFFGAISWSFSGFSIAWLTWGTIVHVALWLPLILLSLDKLLETPNKPRWAVVLLAALVFQFLAGHIQISLYILCLSFVYLVWKKINSKIIWVCILCFIALTSVQWVPLVKTLPLLSRISDIDMYKQVGWFIPWEHLIQFIAPDFFGNPATGNYWGTWNYGEFVGYIGVLGIIFASFAVLHAQEKASQFWKIIFAVSLLFALPTPIAKLPFMLHIPIISSLQPTRLLVLVVFALVILASYGFDRWQKIKSNSIYFPTVLIGIVLLLLWVVSFTARLEVSQKNMILPTVIYSLGFIALIAFRFRKKIVTFLFLILIVMDLFRFGWKFTPFTSREYFFPETKAITFLKVQKKPFRVASLDKRAIPANVLAYFGIETIEGYDPLYSSRYEEYMASVARNNPDISPPFGFNRIVSSEIIDSPLMALLNTRYVLTLKDIDRPYLHKVFEEGETRIYEYVRSVPRAYLVEGVQFAKGKDTIFRALYSMEDYTKSAVVETPIDMLDVPLGMSENAQIVNYQPNAITVRARIVVKRLLVVTNPYSPFWSASIDNKAARIIRTNYIFQGILVPPGDHIVTIRSQL